MKQTCFKPLLSYPKDITKLDYIEKILKEYGDSIETINGNISDIKEDIEGIDGEITDINEALGNKLETPNSYTAGNFLSLDSNGVLVDSTKKPSDFAAASHSHTEISYTNRVGSGSAAVSILSSMITSAAPTINFIFTEQETLLPTFKSCQLTINNVDNLTLALTDPVTSSNYSASGSNSDSKLITAKAVKSAVDNKASKVSGATIGDIATLNFFGDIVDSGYKPTDFASTSDISDLYLMLNPIYLVIYDSPIDLDEIFTRANELSPSTGRRTLIIKNINMDGVDLLFDPNEIFLYSGSDYPVHVFDSQDYTQSKISYGDYAMVTVYAVRGLYDAAAAHAGATNTEHSEDHNQEGVLCYFIVLNGNYPAL